MQYSVISKYNNSIILSTIVDPQYTNKVISHHKDFLKLKYRVIEESELPNNIGLFFDAFSLKDGFDDNSKPLAMFFVIDYTKAKQMWVEFYREARIPLLQSLDVEYMKALEAGDAAKQAEIVAKKQELRDITDINELPDDLDAIKNTWPAALGPKPQMLIKV